jgi:hypothetical protein
MKNLERLPRLARLSRKPGMFIRAGVQRSLVWLPPEGTPLYVERPGR